MEGLHKIKWTLYITIISLFIFVCFTEVGPFSSVVRKAIFTSHLHVVPHKYVIVFDGGSTGTRMHIFTFLNNSSGLLSVENEYFEETKPGLSNFAHEPSSAAVIISKLLEKAKSLVPPEIWDETPVALKATAGLRLLPSHLSESILEEVSKALHNSPFLSNENCVSVLDGEDEGLYAWHTLNILLDTFSDPKRSVVALDLGGGSTQITFALSDLDTFVYSPREYIVNRRIHNRTLSIYSHSYLGLGLMTARLGILSISGEKKVNLSSDKTFSTSCLPPKMKVNWIYDQAEYTILGREDGKYGYKYCYDKAVEFLSDNIDQPEELWKREIYALAYYFDVAADLNIVGKQAGVTTVGEYMDVCKRVCSEETLSKWYLCLDCSYITALLHHGFGFDRMKEIKLLKEIGGFTTSWGLGAAFNMIV